MVIGLFHIRKGPEHDSYSFIALPELVDSIFYQRIYQYGFYLCSMAEAFANFGCIAT